MGDRLPWERPLGAVPEPGGTTTFRVWAPRARRVTLELDGRAVALEGEDGVFEARADAAPGEDYRLRPDDGEALPDPCSRHQPEGVRGPARVVDPAAFDWDEGGWPGLDPRRPVLYELHVGTFTPEGTFAAAAERLPALAELGVTAIELMPVATFPGRRNWGYDGLYAWAPHQVYGGPQGLAGLVAAAHRAGLGVILDVVYNHLGPGAEALEAFGPYHTDRYGTPWGAAMNFDDRDSGGVREWAIQNACMWLSEYRLDGLRVDAVHAIHDDGARHVLAELCARAAAGGRRGRGCRPGRGSGSRRRTGAAAGRRPARRGGGGGRPSAGPGRRTAAASPGPGGGARRSRRSSRRARRSAGRAGRGGSRRPTGHRSPSRPPPAAG